MKFRIIYLLLLVPLFYFADCGKRFGERCVRYLNFYNKSNDTVFYGKKDLSCAYRFIPIGPKGSERTCVEDLSDDGSRVELVVVAKDSVLASGRVNVKCDSLYQEHTVLKRFSLSLQDMRDVKYDISYP